MIITEVSFTIHASHLFIPESCFYFLNSDILDWLYYIMHIFFSKRILCDFCTETFPEVFFLQGGRDSTVYGRRELGLTLELHLHSKLMAFTLVIFLFGLEVGNQDWGETRIFSS